jgi:hypothetical protein
MCFSCFLILGFLVLLVVDSQAALIVLGTVVVLAWICGILWVLSCLWMYGWDKLLDKEG